MYSVRFGDGGQSVYRYAGPFDRAGDALQLARSIVKGDDNGWREGVVTAANGRDVAHVFMIGDRVTVLVGLDENVALDECISCQYAQFLKGISRV